MMEFGKNYDGSGVPIGRSFISMSFIHIEKFLFFTKYTDIGSKKLKLWGPLWGPNIKSGTNDHRRGFHHWKGSFHSTSCRFAAKSISKKNHYQTCLKAKYEKNKNGAP
jgi:hypothetical protein